MKKAFLYGLIIVGALVALNLWYRAYIASAAAGPA